MPEAQGRPVSDAPGAVADERVRVLVVDDTPDVRRLVAGVIALHDAGWLVVADAKDGREAVERAREVQPDIVLLDLAMPVMDGLEALPLLREAAPDALVVVLTGFPADAARDSALAAGAHAYVEKDALVATLVPLLQEAFAAHARSGGGRP